MVKPFFLPETLPMELNQRSSPPASPLFEVLESDLQSPASQLKE
jgi:hypothetical protein